MEAVRLHVGPTDQEPPKTLRLDLTVRDADVVVELCRHREGAEREGYALAALKVGILAVHQAAGAIDAEAIRREGDQLMAEVRTLLAANLTEASGTISGALAKYFDPSSGELPQRLERLTRKDGDLEALLARHLDGETSTIARTLAEHVGQHSPVVRLLSPDASDGVVAVLTETIAEALDVQKAEVLAQFSLDNRDSALSRLVGELTDANGRFRDEFARDVEAMKAQFSLDNEQGALARLVARVNAAGQAIERQLSLDSEDSALSRLARVLDRQEKANEDFRVEVRQALAAMQARREEAARSTRHGTEFEEAVGGLLQHEAQRLGDRLAATGSKPGARRNCKVGDYIVTLSAESAAPGAAIVVEAKENASYDLEGALTELAVARENREAGVGIFVFSKLTAPEGLEPLARHGDDIVVIWDRDRGESDVYLRAALSLARALVVRARLATEKSEVDFGEIDKAISRIARDVESLAEVATWAGNVKRDGGKILDRAEKVREDLEAQLETLREHLEGLRSEPSEGET